MSGKLLKFQTIHHEGLSFKDFAAAKNVFCVVKNLALLLYFLSVVCLYVFASAWLKSLIVQVIRQLLMCFIYIFSIVFVYRAFYNKSLVFV